MDASVVAKLLWEEPGSDLASRLFERRGTSWAAPDLLAYEVGNVIRFQRSLREAERSAALDDFYRLRIRLLPMEQAAMGEALALGSARGITLYDAAYVVLARRLGTSLVTADAKLARKLRDPRVVPLSADLPEDA